MDRQGNRDIQKVWVGHRSWFLSTAAPAAFRALLAGDLGFHPSVGTSAINGKIAGGNIAIINGVVNTLPYYIVGNPAIKSQRRSQRPHRGRTYTGHGGRLCLAPGALKSINLPYNQIKAITVGGGPARDRRLDQRPGGIHHRQRRREDSRRTGWVRKSSSISPNSKCRSNLPAPSRRSK